MSQREDMDQDWIGRLSVDDLRYKLRGALSELVLVEDTLAGALGYPRSDGGPDDPNGGGYVIGEHTAVTLAAEAGHALARAEASRRDWAAIAMLHDMYFEHWERGTLDDPEPLEPGANAPCSCLTPEGAAFVAAQPKWSLPLCAVHPEADR